MVGEVALGQGREQGRHHAQAHGAGRKVDVVWVFRAAGVRLEAVELAQPRQVLAVQVPQQVLQRVEGGRSVRLDRDAVASAQILQVEGGEQGDSGCRGRLV